MKTKTKMPKAMYGKTMMKKGGIKKMQKGGTKKSLSKAQLGENFQGPVTKKTNELVNKEYKEYTGPRVYDQDVKDADELKRLRENYDRIPKEKKGGSVRKMQQGGPTAAELKAKGQKMKAKGAALKTIGKNLKTVGLKLEAAGMHSKNIAKEPIRAKVDEFFGINTIDNYKTPKYPKGDTYKKGGMVKRKMKTGGMVNPNSSVSKQTVAGSKGVTSGVNAKASASKVASSRGSGRANTPPSKAVPVAKRGGMVKRRK